MEKLNSYNSYDPYDIFKDLDVERLASNERRRLRNAANEIGAKGNAGDGKGIWGGKREIGVFCIDKGQEIRVEEVAPKEEEVGITKRPWRKKGTKWERQSDGTYKQVERI